MRAATAGAAALAAMLVAAPALATERYPVWWSQALELQSLDDIDTRLSRPFVTRGKGAPVYKGKGADRKTEYVNSCASLFRWSEQGYSAFANVYLKALNYQKATCRIIELLRDAKPARMSHVRTFTLDAEAINYLPAMVDLHPLCGAVGPQYLANDKGIPLAQFSKVGKVEVIGPHEMRLDSVGSRVRVATMARGDFNGDGLDDLVVRVSAHVTDGTWGATTYLTLSRASPGVVLRVLDAAKELCRDYDYPFDHPEPGG